MFQTPSIENKKNTLIVILFTPIIDCILIQFLDYHISSKVYCNTISMYARYLLYIIKQRRSQVWLQIVGIHDIYIEWYVFCGVILSLSFCLLGKMLKKPLGMEGPRDSVKKTFQRPSKAD